jgi:hypothetical protein
MRRLPAAIAGLAATAFFATPLIAHHSMAMFDTSKEVLIKGKGRPVRLEESRTCTSSSRQSARTARSYSYKVKASAITQALVDGPPPEGSPVGAQVVVRANPNRNGPDKTVRLLDVTTQDGEIHPFYAANSKSPHAHAGDFSRRQLGAVPAVDEPPRGE